MSDKFKKWLAAFVKRHIVDDDPHEPKPVLAPPPATGEMVPLPVPWVSVVEVAASFPGMERHVQWCMQGQYFSKTPVDAMEVSRLLYDKHGRQSIHNCTLDELADIINTLIVSRSATTRRLTM